MLERDKVVGSECLCAIDRYNMSMHQPPPRMHVCEVCFHGLRFKETDQ